VWLELGVGVPECAGERTDRMPGIDACDPDGWAADGCAPKGWAVGVAPSPGESADKMPGIDGCVPDPAEPVGECEAELWLAAPLGAAAWAWLAVAESNRYKLYSRMMPIRFAPYSGSVA
jgi:hypothetical protein